MNAVVHEAINRQINAELTASYSYMQMSAFCARHISPWVTPEIHIAMT